MLGHDKLYQIILYLEKRPLNCILFFLTYAQFFSLDAKIMSLKKKMVFYLNPQHIQKIEIKQKIFTTVVLDLNLQFVYLCSVVQIERHKL